MCSKAWTKKSDLGPSNWDPYPELQNPANCYGNNVENYCCNSNAVYLREQNTVSVNSAPNLTRSIGIFSPMAAQMPLPARGIGTNEGFVQDMRCCGPTPYNNLNKTWGLQKPFTL